MNEIADRAADAVHDTHKTLVEVCARYEGRFRVYVQKMLCLLGMYAKILRSHDALVSARMEENADLQQRHESDDCITIYLDRTDEEEEQQGVKIQSRLPANDKAAHCAVRKSVWDFMCWHTWVPTKDIGEAGTTWAELLITFLLEGGSLQCREDSETKRISFRSALQEFRNVLRSLAAIGCDTPDRGIFAPARARVYPLARLGIMSNMPSIRAKIVLAPALARRKDHVLACIAHRLSRSKRTLFWEQGFIETSRSHWISRVPMQWPRSMVSGTSWPVECTLPQSTMPYGTRSVFQLFLACPEEDCDHLQDVSGRTLWKGSVWSLVGCARCGKQSSSRRWRCTCGRLWSTCVLHRRMGFICGRRARKKIAQSARKRRVVIGNERQRGRIETRKLAHKHDENCSLWLCGLAASQNMYARGRSFFESTTPVRGSFAWLRCSKLVDKFPLLAARERRKLPSPPRAAPSAVAE